MVMATLNAGAVQDGCLRSIREQDYDQRGVEIIAADGGSTDGTLELFERYGVVVVKENTGSPEAAKAVALKIAKNELVLEVDEDNVLPDRGWLKKMVECLEKEPEATGVYTWRYRHQKEAKSLNRYFSLIGVNDPVARFLGRADRQSYSSDEWTLSGVARDKGEYFLVEFEEDNLPTVGANGFLIWRKLLMEAKVDEENFFHIDVNMDLVRKGYKKYVVVKNDVIHISGESILKFFKKRYRYMKELYMNDYGKRRYFLYNPKTDKFKIVLYSLSSLTLIWPILEALEGFARIQDWAWFWHPVVCFFMFWIYAVAVLRSGIKGTIGYLFGMDKGQ